MIVEATTTGLLDLALMDFSSFTGGWFYSDFLPMPVPQLFGTTVQIVPLPAAVWFLLTGVAIIAGLRRRASQQR